MSAQPKINLPEACSEQEADLFYADVAESFLRKINAVGPITPPESIAVQAVITRLRRYAQAQIDTDAAAKPATAVARVPKA